MKRFLIPVARPARQSSEGENPSERARAFAEGIGLAWPWKGPQGPGRPNIQIVYERTLAQMLQRREWAALEGVSTKEVPPLWREGMLVGKKFEEYLQGQAAEMLAHKASSSTPEAAQEKEADTAATAAAAAAADMEEAEEEEEDPEEPAAKKRKTTRPKGFVPQALSSVL